MARRDSSKQIPTPKQAALLLLASQPGGTYQAEVCRITRRDSLGINGALRAMLKGVWKRVEVLWYNKDRIELLRKARKIKVYRYGRGWLTRRVKKRCKLRNRWRYTITPAGTEALMRFFQQQPNQQVHDMMVGVQFLAAKVKGWFAISGIRATIWQQAAIALSDPELAGGWQIIQRGRDLALPGWGPPRQLAEAIAGILRHCHNKTLVWQPPPVGNLQLMAYGGPELGRMCRLLQVGFEPDEINWLVQWRDWWLANILPPPDPRYAPLNQSEVRYQRLSRLDEIEQCRRHGIALNGHPEAVFAMIPAQPADEGAWGYNPREKELLTKPFAAQPVEVQTPAGKLITVTSDKDLLHYGKVLHNCLGRYDIKCREEGRLIAVLTNDAGKPLAAGEWIDGEWGQIAGPCNQKPDKVIKIAFQKHGKELAKLAFTENLEPHPHGEPLTLEGEVHDSTETS